MLSLLVCKFCLKLTGKIVGLAHLVFFNYLEQKLLRKQPCQLTNLKMFQMIRPLQMKKQVLQQHQLVFIYIFFVEMKCFLCQFEADIPTLKDHYQEYHLIDSTDENF